MIKFNALYKYHDHVYILTIPRARERHESIKEELPGWNLELFMGMDKNEVTLQHLAEKGIIDITKNKEIDPDSRYTEGFVSCSYGHKMIYKDMIEKGYKRVLILEDDALTNDVSESYLEKAIRAMPEDAELVYWGWTNGVVQNPKAPFIMRKLSYFLKKTSGLLKKYDATNYGKYSMPVNKYFDTAGMHAGTYAYSVNRSGAKKLMDLQTPIIFHADRLFRYAIKNDLIKAYIMNPSIFVDATYFGHKKFLPSLIDYA